jgi:hypothetical protein
MGVMLRVEWKTVGEIERPEVKMIVEIGGRGGDSMLFYHKPEPSFFVVFPPATQFDKAPGSTVVAGQTLWR